MVGNGLGKKSAPFALNPHYLHATNMQLRLWEIVQHPLTMTSKDERSASVLLLI